VRALALVAMLFAAGIAHADAIKNVQRMSNLVAQIAAKETTLSTININLAAMRKADSSEEGTVIQAALDSGFLVAARLSGIDATGSLVSMMATSADRAMVIGKFGSEAESASDQIRTQIIAVNAYLLILRKPAAINEVTRLRDTQIEINNLLKGLSHSLDPS
jgi:hypothetical protein